MKRIFDLSEFRVDNSERIYCCHLRRKSNCTAYVYIPSGTHYLAIIKALGTGWAARYRPRRKDVTLYCRQHAQRLRTDKNTIDEFLVPENFKIPHLSIVGAVTPNKGITGISPPPRKNARPDKQTRMAQRRQQKLALQLHLSTKPEKK